MEWRLLLRLTMLTVLAEGHVKQGGGGGEVVDVYAKDGQRGEILGRSERERERE